MPKYSSSIMDDMQINMDFTRPVALIPEDTSWVPSPLDGVERKMLERNGGEHTSRATSIVRYAPASCFTEHVHTGGEEIFVLAGVFSDEHGDYPAGSYIRNPIGTRHSPHSHEGCTLFVKLEQFSPDDDRQCIVDTNVASFTSDAGNRLSRLHLHQTVQEKVEMVKMAAGAKIQDRNCNGGAELLVIEGCLSHNGQDYPGGSWLRFPHRSDYDLTTAQGCKFYLKTGHLP